MDISGALSEMGRKVAHRADAKELNSTFEVLACWRELAGCEINYPQNVMSSPQHRRSRSLLGHGEDSSSQLSREPEIKPPVVRQSEEDLHELGIFSQLLAQLTRADESMLEFWQVPSGHEQ